MKNNYSVEERNRIVEEHLWCVKSVVNKYRAKIKAAGMEVEDIRQELSIRLIRAVEKYDPQTCELRDHIFSELNDELRLCMEPARAFGLTDAPQSIRGSAFVSLTRARNIPSMDKAFCEKHQAAYEAAMEAFHEFSFFWADMVEAQHELLQEKENYKNKEYLDTSVGVKVDEDRIRENIECLHSKLIRSLVSHFKSTYKVSIDYYDIEQHILPQKPSCYAGEEERRAYHEKMDTMVIQYRDVVDLIILQLGGRSFSEQAEYEIKEAARNAVWDWHSKSATFAVKKSTITLTGYFCSYEADFDRWSLSSNMIKVLYALAYYETGTAGILPRRITDLIEDYRQYCDVIELEGCEKATKLRMFKNGRVDITFASPDCARCFAKDYFGEQWESAA